MKVLAVESSCDETSAAVVETAGEAPGAVTRALSSVVASQVELHALYGGVVPELASRRHIEAVIPTVAQALEDAKTRPEELGGVGATRGPGLVGALLVGLNFAKAFAAARGLPFVGVNHLDGHLHAIFLEENPPAYPFVALLVSGGHTHLYFVRGFADYELLGRTVDDAAGEAFDKTAKVIGLPYPGGPGIDRLAKDGDPKAFALPRGMLVRGNLDFSFSGLKTAVMVRARELGDALPARKADLAASMQEAVADVLSAKLLAAMDARGVTRGVVSGGVAANSRLRSILEERTKGSTRRIFFPRMALCTDNAAMIGYVAAQRLLRGERDSWTSNADPALLLA
ncbi:MAG TPA: tRNA (adenosine(37)-N6)-threonylcarbamoyltransferase complex transferase subunit TsaD [bacterium]|nr:tRNA (adenosine(37)-N6)-threonylcarbamoyltransferase complex transferase subunit TsaD [bacterium]